MDKTSALTTPTPTIDISEEEKSRLIALANDPGTRGMLSPEDLAKVESIEKAEGKVVAKSLETTSTVPEEISKDNQFNFWETFNAENFGKKEDKIVTIVDLVTETNTMLGKILNVNSINGTTSAYTLDAINQEARTTAEAYKNMARISSTQQKNSIGQIPSLAGSEKPIKGIA
jgi:hypothetical protein